MGSDGDSPQRRQLRKLKMGENYETISVTTLPASCSAQPWVTFPKHINVPIIPRRRTLGLVKEKG